MTEIIKKSVTTASLILSSIRWPRIQQLPGQIDTIILTRSWIDQVLVQMNHSLLVLWYAIRASAIRQHPLTEYDLGQRLSKKPMQDFGHWGWRSRV